MTDLDVLSAAAKVLDSLKKKHRHHARWTLDGTAFWVRHCFKFVPEPDIRYSPHSVALRVGLDRMEATTNRKLDALEGMLDVVFKSLGACDLPKEA